MTLIAVLVSSACIVVGLLWDISWRKHHRARHLLDPPHLLERLGAIAARLSCGWLVLHATLAGSAGAGRVVRFWGFSRTAGGWVTIWGTS